MAEEDDHIRQMEERWNREWGPQIGPWKRRLSAIFVIIAFAGLIVGAVLTAGR